MKRSKTAHNQFYKQASARSQGRYGPARRTTVPYELRGLRSSYLKTDVHFRCNDIGVFVGRPLELRQEVVLGKHRPFWTKEEFEIVNLRKDVWCDECEGLLNLSERRVFEKLKNEMIEDVIQEVGEYNPIKLQDGLSTERYFGEEYDENGMPSATYYGVGSAYAMYNRQVFHQLEIIAFCETILADFEDDEEFKAAKRRFVKTATECIECIKYHHSYPSTNDKNKEGDRLRHLMEANFALGYLVSEYSWKFKSESAVTRGLDKAKKERARGGEIRRKVSIAAANEILMERPELVSNLSSLAIEIEDRKLQKHKMKNGNYIAREAIVRHLKWGLIERKIKIT